MAKLMDEDVRQTKKTANPPAWAGNSKPKNSREEKIFGEVKAGAGMGQQLPAAVLNARDPNIGRPADEAYFANAARQDEARRVAAVMEQTSARDDGPRPPAWMALLSRPPAYSGAYNPTVYTREQNQEPVEPRVPSFVPSYLGEPVNDSMSDMLRSLRPLQLGSGDMNTSMSDTLRTIAAGTPYTQIPFVGGRGMGSQYRGNWRGGGGGGGGGGYGYDEYPAWAANMGLYSLKWGG